MRVKNRLPQSSLLRTTTWVNVLSALSLGLLLAATPGLAATFVVNSTGDSGDNLHGDGLCFTGIFIATGSGAFAPQCTLRAAIEETNAFAGADVVEFSAALPKVANVVEIRPDAPLPFIADTLTIDGYSAEDYDVSDPDESPVINLSGSNVGGTGGGLVVWHGGSGSTIRGLAVINFPAGGIVVTAQLQPIQNVTIEGCHVGIARGVFYQGNGAHGIAIRGARNIVIGRTCGTRACSGQRNVISANDESGVQLLNSNFVEVVGNRIGTDRSGMATFVPFGGSTSNGESGIEIEGGGRNTIGRSLPGGENLISGNAAGGIRIESAGNVVTGNKIGTNRTGTASLANLGSGVHLVAGPNTVGSVGAGRNIISGNTGYGLWSVGPNTIVGNIVGLSEDQTQPIGNGSSGISLDGSGALVRGNALGGNDVHGMLVFGDSHQILANLIGTNASREDLQNGLHGVVLSGTHSVELGRAGVGNTIGFNSFGIGVTGSTGANWIEGNWIGTDESGADIGNTSNGVYLSNNADTMIGAADGLTNGSGNVIAFNAGSGIRIVSTPAAGNSDRIVGNYIGTNAEGAPMGNAKAGVSLSFVERGVIGADLGADPSGVASHGNSIAFNEQSAVLVEATGLGVTVRGNELYANGGGAVPVDLGSDGPTDNDVGDIDTGANQLQNTPEFLADQTQLNTQTGDLEVRYRINSNEADAAYPLTVDYYLLTMPGGFADVYVGSDVYPAASATLYRSVAIKPPEGLEISGMLLATATDANGNTSELSRQSIPVPEPGFGCLLIAGSGLLAGHARRQAGGPARRIAHAGRTANNLNATY